MSTLKLHAFINELGSEGEVLYVCQDHGNTFIYARKGSRYEMHCLHTDRVRSIDKVRYIDELLSDYDDHRVSFLIPPKLTLEEAKRERDNP